MRRCRTCLVVLILGVSASYWAAFAVLVFHPVYRKGLPLETSDERRTALSGFALGVVRVRDLLLATLLRDDDGVTTPVVSLLDESAEPATRMLSSNSSLQATAGENLPIDHWIAFYDFSAQHWQHIRTTNPIESMFATVRLRHRRTKGSGTRAACLAMVFKLAQTAEKKWRRLNGSLLLRDLIDGVKFKDGTKVDAA